jgi:hypothetical protein
MQGKSSLVIFVLLTAGIPPERYAPSTRSSARDMSRVTFLGEFSNMRFTEEHAYGVAIELWREGNSVFGLLDFADGLQGDTPTGLLQDAAFDPTSGRVSFKAKLTVGLHCCRQHRNVPSRDLFEFSGKLREARLTGNLTRSDALHPEHRPHAEEVLLKKTEEVASPIEAVSYVEWRRKVDAILRFRGPKW